MHFMRRTHTCGELREAEVGQTVVLNGWVNTYRDQGEQVFIDLRDRYGITQVVFEPDAPRAVRRRPGAAQRVRARRAGQGRAPAAGQGQPQAGHRRRSRSRPRSCRSSTAARRRRSR